MKTKQKFLRGHKVKIADEMPMSMRHFTKGVNAIIQGSYRDLCSRSESNPSNPSYSVVILDEFDNPITSCAWYYENLLTLIDTDRDKGEDILQKYNEDDEDDNEDDD